MRGYGRSGEVLTPCHKEDRDDIGKPLLKAVMMCHLDEAFNEVFRLEHKRLFVVMMRLLLWGNVCVLFSDR